MPRRIAITGTRGKSGVTRLIASGLRASGAKVLAKTTGSKPLLIFPDGTEREIVRTGPASIREQARLLSLAASLGADTLVAEMMSIGAECLGVESRRILRPAVLAVTNVRLDHLDEMGRDRRAIAATMAAAIPERAEIFIPGEEADPAFDKAAARRGAKLHLVPPDDPSGAGAGGGPASPAGEFEPNRRLARAVLRSLGLDDATISRGFAAARPDPGSLRIRRGVYGQPPRPAVCVGLFAANDPGSSAIALAQALAALPPAAGRPLVGLLSLREDRGDRTRQWIEAAERGFFRDFIAVYLVGPPARAARRRIRRRLGDRLPVAVAEGRTPEGVMGRILSSAAAEPIVVGLGNFVGWGEKISRYWDDQGTEHGA